MTEMFNLPKLGIGKLPSKPTKEKEKQKEMIVYPKFVSLNALVDRER